MKPTQSMRGLWILLFTSTIIKDVVGLCTKPTMGNNVVLAPDNLKDKFDDKSTIKLQCLPGFEPTAASPKSFTCEGVQWKPASGSFVCQKVSCRIPGDLSNGRYEFLEGIEFGAFIRAVCNEGYNMVGDSTRSCQANGEWTGTEPVCEAATCALPPAIPSGQVQFKPGQELQYVCSPGFILRGGTSASPDTVRCLGNGSWSKEPQCVGVSCNIPNIPNARRVEGGNGPYYGYKATVRYECNEGYRMLSGTSQMVCLENGWSSTPKCEAECTTPLGLESERIPDGKMTASSTLSKGILGRTWEPHYARLDHWGRINAWSPATNDRLQWLQVDLDKPKRFTGIITQGAKDYGVVQYVSAFKIAYSNDGSSWTVLKDTTTNSDKVFQGNTDNDTHKQNLFSPPFYARYVRFLPWEWHDRITLRMELLGCDQ
ncbi:sushi, von Willebrand factor type A, EGF and pentraxin domain-containing protein 1-like isoform X1 [Engraulis encrasicolus]|uniref:sushi, von Willebrand factor type A, EGF and pentraxin domain-containing protein 1-like isoform X1 n=1 Tax=Engraulis encrasicolus TaxID=184585 RepID=UPI002FD34851